MRQAVNSSSAVFNPADDDAAIGASLTGALTSHALDNANNSIDGSTNDPIELHSVD